MGNMDKFCKILNSEVEWLRYAWISYAISVSDNGLSPDWRRTITRTNAASLLIGPMGVFFHEMLTKYIFLFGKVLKMCLQNTAIFFRP